jgi:hypothetical protein
MVLFQTMLPVIIWIVILIISSTMVARRDKSLSDYVPYIVIAIVSTPLALVVIGIILDDFFR